MQNAVLTAPSNCFLEVAQKFFCHYQKKGKTLISQTNSSPQRKIFRDVECSIDNPAGKICQEIDELRWSSEKEKKENSPMEKK